MARESHAIVQKHGVRIAEQKRHLWTFDRPAQMSVASRVIEEQEEDLMVLGPITGQQGARLTSK